MGTLVPIVNNYLGKFVTIGNRLREERERLKHSQNVFAEIGGVGRKSQFNYEENERRPDAAYLAAISSVGADVQYILTGVRSSMALTPEESVLLDGYRAMDAATRRRVLAFILEGKGEAKQEQVFNAEVGQAIKVDGNLDQKGISFFKGRGKKK